MPHRSAIAIKPFALYFEGYLCAGETAPIYPGMDTRLLGLYWGVWHWEAGSGSFVSSGFLGVLVSMDRTFSGMSQRCSIRLGTGEFAGQVNVLSWGHWHWGMPLPGGLLPGPQVFWWVVCVNCQNVAPTWMSGPGISQQNMNTALDDQCFTLSVRGFNIPANCGLSPFPKLQRVCSVPVTGVPDLLSYSHSWFGLGTETTWLSLGKLRGLGLK